MNERLLQYIWQFQHFNISNLTTVSGEPISIINRGAYNTSQGPDFLNGKIKYAGIEFAGSIELHVKASEWVQHGHSTDSNYNNCILHVVWECDRDIGLGFPTIELKDRVSSMLLAKYQTMLTRPDFIPCGNQLTSVEATTFSMWKQRLLVERLQDRTRAIHAVLEATNFHWEESFHRLLLKNFGMKVNGEAFAKLGETVTSALLGRHRSSIIQLEALLFGAADLLREEAPDKYSRMLRKEYDFLQHKYNLKTVPIAFYFLRMRPANFPTVRLAQYAALVTAGANSFALLRDRSAKELRKSFDVCANDYWHYHYRFGEESAYRVKTLGTQMIDNILINTIAPMLYAYGWYNDQSVYKERAVQLLENLSAEENAVSTGFKTINAKPASAADSQALLQLKNKYCDARRCLECAVGVAILRSNPT